MASYYGVPVHCLGPDSDSHAVDQQSAWEKMLIAVVNIVAGVDLQINAGMFETGMSLSLAQLVMDSELIGIARRFREGLTIDRERLAEDVIRRVNGSPVSDYMTHELTLRFLRSGEHREPLLTTRINYDEWWSKGGIFAAETAARMANEMLSGTPRVILNPIEQQELDRLLQEARQCSQLV